MAKIPDFSKKRFLSPFKISLYSAIVFVLFYFWVNLVGNVRKNDVITNFDKKIIDFFMSTRKIQPISNQVALVTADAKSVKEIGRWPWPRYYMTNMLKTLNEYYQVKVIGFDIVFSEPDQSFLTLKNTLDPIPSNIFPEKPKKVILAQKNYDLQFSEEINRWDNIVTGFFFRNDLSQTSVTEEMKKAYTRAVLPMRIKNVIEVDNQPNFKEIHTGEYPEVNNFYDRMNENYKAGYFSITPDSNDGVVRRVESVFRYQDNFYTSLPIKIYQTYLQKIEPDKNHDIAILFGQNGMINLQIGEHVFATDEDSTLRINYRGPDQTIPHFSFYDVLHRTFPKESLKDKLVIIGVTELGVYDIRSTPVGATYPGVEIQGTILDNLLMKNTLQENDFTRAVSLLIILLVALGTGWIKKKWGNLWGDFLVIFLFLALFFNNFYWLNSSNLVFSTAFPLAAGTLAWFLGLIYTTFSEEKDKKFIKSAFGQYLAPKVIDQLLLDPSQLKLGGERKVLSILFTDLQGFSSISEKADIHQLTAILNEYLTKMVDIIMMHSGTVDKFEGDAIIAFWGAPIFSDQHALEACSAVVDMQKEMLILQENYKKSNLPMLNMRVGLHTGEVMVGNFGSSQRMDYTVIGDSANLAARLEGVNKVYGTYTLISEKTLKLTEGRFTTRYIDEVQVVGKQESVKIFELQGYKKEASPEQLQKNALYEKAYQFYRKMQWEEAIKTWNEVLKISPADGPSKVFLQRTQNWLKNPPKEDWTGVHRLDSK